MATQNALKKLIFESYNGMSRPAMFWSIPIMPFVGLLMGGLLFGIAATALLSWVWGVIAILPFVITLITLRFICLIDPQYLRRIRFAWRRLKLNFQYGRPLLLTPFNAKWSVLYGTRFSQTRHAAGSEKRTGDALSSTRKYGNSSR